MADQFQLKAILSAVDRMSPVLKRMQTTAKSTRKYLADLGNSASNLSGRVGLPLTALSGLLTGFGVGAIKKAMTGYAESGEEAYKGSLKTGLAVEQWQRLKYVFEQSGVSVEAMEASMGQLNKRLGLVASGKGKDLVGLFTKLHITLRDKVTGEMRSAGDILPQVADAFARNTNPVTRARMGFALFGKQWAEVVPLLVEGSAGIEQLTKRFGRLKGVMSEADARAAKDWGDLMGDVGVVVKGFSNTIAKELVPVLSPVVDGLIMWAAENKKLIASEVKVFVRDLVNGLRQFDWVSLANGVRSFGSSLAWLVDKVGGAQNALIGLVVVMNLQALAAAVSLASSIWRAGSALLGFALTAIAPVAPLQSLSTAMLAANVSGAKLIGTMGKVGALAGVAGAAFAGWEVGGWLNNNAVNPLVKALTGDKDQTLGGWIYDVTHGADAGAKAPLVTPTPSSRVNGEIRVSFDNAPPGMRVVQTTAQGGVSLNPDVGYRSIGAGAF